MSCSESIDRADYIGVVLEMADYSLDSGWCAEAEQESDDRCSKPDWNSVGGGAHANSGR